MNRLPHVVTICASVMALNLLQRHQITNAADFWTGIGAALTCSVFLIALYRLIED